GYATSDLLRLLHAAQGDRPSQQCTRGWGVPALAKFPLQSHFQLGGLSIRPGLPPHPPRLRSPAALQPGESPPDADALPAVPRASDLLLRLPPAAAGQAPSHGARRALRE